jgi:hypothetical protein
MHDEFEIQARNLPAGVAFAARCLLNVGQPPTELEIFDRVLKERAVDLRRIDISEVSIAFYLREMERQAQRAYHGVDQSGQNVLCVIKLDASELSCSRICRQSRGRRIRVSAAWGFVLRGNQAFYDRRVSYGARGARA